MGSSIEWTGRTLNAFVGCRRVSDGCTRCYAERLVHRGLSKQHRGLTVMSTKGPRWNGQVNYTPHRFDEMLRTEKRDMWFINSPSDLFFEPVPFETIAALLGMMAVANERAAIDRDWMKVKKLLKHEKPWIYERLEVRTK